MHFPISEGFFFNKNVSLVKAVDGINFTIKKGETLGLVGESGCGKTTTGRCILQLEKVTEGKILYEGQDLTQLDSSDLSPLRQKIQVIFQDPYSSLNPRLKIGDTIAEPMKVHHIEPDPGARKKRVAELLNICGLPSVMADRYPHEMSGGQRQRVGIARALSLKPEFIICDEVTSALDQLVAEGILRLLVRLQTELDLTFMFITHDFGLVADICDYVAVMYAGVVVEFAPTLELFDNPAHPYTQGLFGALPQGRGIGEKAEEYEDVAHGHAVLAQVTFGGGALPEPEISFLPWKLE